MHIGRFGSLMKPEWTQELAFGELFDYFLREAGVNTWDAHPNYLTTDHHEGGGRSSSPGSGLRSRR